MSENAFLNIRPHRYQLSDSLSDDIDLLDDLLGNILLAHGDDELIQTAQQLYDQAYGHDPQTLFDEFPKLKDTHRLNQILRAFTMLFQLINLAEQKEIIRVNRQRQAQASASPRQESLFDTIAKMKQAGVSAKEMQALIHNMEIGPTLTAHPTEARRRAVLDKLEVIARLLVEYNQPDGMIHLDQPLNRNEKVKKEIVRALNALWLTEELSFNPVTVEEEIRNSIYFIEHTIFDVVSWLHHDLAAALKQSYPEQEFEIPAFLKYRTWVGGDRDGNPKVTPDITWWAILYQRRKALRMYIDRIDILLRDYTQSTRLVPPSQTLLDSLEAEKHLIQLPKGLLNRYTDEPYACKLLYIRARLAAGLDDLRTIEDFHTVGQTVEFSKIGYRNHEAFLADLSMIQTSLRQGRAPHLADEGLLADLIIQVKTFAFNLAMLDVRQHSEVHEAVLDEVIEAANLLGGRKYSELPESEKARLLANEMYNPRPLLPRGWQGSEDTQQLLNVFRVIRRSIHLFGPQTIQSYIISMTHTVSDVLEVLVLAKEMGLIRLKRNQENEIEFYSDIDVVPLFETIDDLERSDKLMRELFTNQAYAMHLKSRGMNQEIMLGYSDSSKDGGFMAANWYLNDTQDRLAKLCERHEVDLQLFHGRGGTVGRGGGRAYLAIQGQAPGSMHGRIRFTEQGEVISFRYSYAPIAHRHTEQIVGAVMLASCPQTRTSDIADEWKEAMGKMAEHSRQSFRNFVYNNDDFWDFYINATPIKHISQLPIASRPVSRKGDSMVGMEDLRAIPWGFSWVQCRYLITGWYGVGSALEWYGKQSEENLNLLQQMYKEWTFFKLVIDNAQLELIRSHLPTAAWYASLVPDQALAKRMHKRIEEEYERTRDWVLKITQSQELLEHAQTVKHTIELRNPIVAPINRLQVALLKQYEQSKRGKKDGTNTQSKEIREAMLLSITGIAAAMQSTG